MSRSWQTDPTLDDLRKAEILLARAATRLGAGTLTAQEAASLSGKARRLRLGLKHAIIRSGEVL